MKASDLTVEMCREKLLEIIKRHPRRKNPHIEDQCVYTKGDKHCLIGQMLSELGVALPAQTDATNQQRASIAFPGMSTDVSDLVSRVQEHADGLGDPSNRRQWGSVARILA